MKNITQTTSSLASFDDFGFFLLQLYVIFIIYYCYCFQWKLFVFFFCCSVADFSLVNFSPFFISIENFWCEYYVRHINMFFIHILISHPPSYISNLSFKIIIFRMQNKITSNSSQNGGTFSWEKYSCVYYAYR